MGECTKASNVVVEGDVDLNRAGNKVFDGLKDLSEKSTPHNKSPILTLSFVRSYLPLTST